MAPYVPKDQLWAQVEAEHRRAQPQGDSTEAAGETPPVAIEASAASTPDTIDDEPPAPIQPPPEPPTTIAGEADVIAWLATLRPLDYARERKAAAEALGVTLHSLDAEVRAERARQAPADDRSPFADPVPWPEPVDPAEMLDEIAQTIRRFVVMNPEPVDTNTLWNVQTYVADCFDTSPILADTSAEPGSGKTTLLSTLGRICHRPLLASHASPSSIFRAVEKWQPTLIIDEGDTFLRHNPELHGLLNAGHGRGGFVLRTVPRDDDFEPRAFRVFGPKLVAGNALRQHLPGTTLTRCIVIDMHRRRPNAPVERLRDADPALFDRIKSKIARFKLDYAEQLRSARPHLPDTLSDRAQDNWAPLFAIAECAGPRWVKRATTAALKLSGADKLPASIGNELLADIRLVFAKHSDDKISTVDLLEALAKDAERPWATFDDGERMTPRQLARLLGAYGIRSKTVRLGKTNTPKGYAFADFEDAFARYLPPAKAEPESADGDPAERPQEFFRIDPLGSAPSGDAGDDRPAPPEDDYL